MRNGGSAFTGPVVHSAAYLSGPWLFTSTPPARLSFFLSTLLPDYPNPISNLISPVLNPHLVTHTDTRDSSYPPPRLTHSLSLLYSSGVLFSSFETGCHYVVQASLELVILLPQMRPQTWSRWLGCRA